MVFVCYVQSAKQITFKDLEQNQKSLNQQRPEGNIEQINHCWTDSAECWTVSAECWTDSAECWTDSAEYWTDSAECWTIFKIPIQVI